MSWYSKYNIDKHSKSTRSIFVVVGGDYLSILHLMLVLVLIIFLFGNIPIVEKEEEEIRRLGEMNYNIWENV